MKILIKNISFVLNSINIDRQIFEKTLYLRVSIVLCMLWGINTQIVTAQTLDSLLQQVVEYNPNLKSLQLEYEAELLKKDQVSQLPNPEVGLGVPILKPETRLGPQLVMVSVSQILVWDIKKQRRYCNYNVKSKI